MCVLILQKLIKKEYINHFISKLTDSDAENSETNVWLEFAFECNYITKEIYQKLSVKNIEIGKLINYMINNSGKFGVS